MFNNYLFIEFESSIKIYYFEQGIDDIEPYNAQIYNVYGNLIMSKSAIVNDVINVSDLPAGVYIISLQSEDNKLGRQIKFIKQ